MLKNSEERNPNRKNPGIIQKIINKNSIYNLFLIDPF